MALLTKVTKLIRNCANSIDRFLKFFKYFIYNKNAMNTDKLKFCYHELVRKKYIGYAFFRFIF